VDKYSGDYSASDCQNCAPPRQHRKFLRASAALVQIQRGHAASNAGNYRFAIVRRFNMAAIALAEMSLPIYSCAH